MAQIWTESCQWTTDANKFIRRYTSGGVFYGATLGRNGGPAFSGRWTHFPTNPAPAANSPFIFFMRCRVDGAQDFIGLYAPGTGDAGGSFWAYSDLKVGIAGDGSLFIQRGSSGTHIAQSPPGIVTFVGTLFGIAGKITVHPTAGTCDLYVDGLPVPGMTGLTGLNTSQYGASGWAGFVTDGYYRCDTFIADGTNPTGNDVHDILYDVRVDYRAPNNNGYSSGFGGNDGNSTDNYLLVDDPSPDDDGTYVQSLAPAIDGYTLQDAPAGMQVIGATSLVTCRKTDAGVAVFRQGIRPASTNVMGASYALAVSYVTHSQQHGVNPNGNVPWTEAAFNATELVVEKV